MKKAFEFILVLIIFYGVYSAFGKAAPVIFGETESLWVILVALVVSALLVVLYSAMVGGKVAKKMKGDIETLKNTIKEKEEKIIEKEEEVKKAQSFKEDLIAEAEKTID